MNAGHPVQTELVTRLPSKALFYRDVPEPLTEEERLWLVEQLHRYPTRVDEARTCAIGALTDMAVTEFCRLMADRERLASSERRLREALVFARSIINPHFNDVHKRAIEKIDAALTHKEEQDG